MDGHLVCDKPFVSTSSVIMRSFFQWDFPLFFSDQWMNENRFLLFFSKRREKNCIPTELVVSLIELKWMTNIVMKIIPRNSCMLAIGAASMLWMLQEENGRNEMKIYAFTINGYKFMDRRSRLRATFCQKKNTRTHAHISTAGNAQGKEKVCENGQNVCSMQTRS